MKMKPRHVLGMLLGFDLLAGLLDAREIALGLRPSVVGVVATLVLSFLCFYWYRLDSDERGYRRSKWLNIGIVSFALGAVPYYVARSRPTGQKARALLRLVGFALLQIVAVVIGAVAGAVFYGLS